MTEPYKMVFASIISFSLLCGLVFIYRIIYPKRYINLLILIILLSIPPVISFLRKGIPASNDFILHTVFSISFFNALSDGILFPQWAADVAGGYGLPYFAFNYNTPYYLASFFHVFGFTFIDSMKLVFISAYLLSGIMMYLWAKEEFGRIGGFLAAVFYQFAPYHLIIMHFYTSAGMSVAFAFLPIPFLCIKKYVMTKKYRWFFALATSFAIVILTHQTMTLAIIPFFTIYTYILCRRNRFNFFISTLGLFLGMCLTAYYWLPLLFQSKYVAESFSSWVKTEHFIDLIYSPYGFGFLFQGHFAETKFIIGYVQLIVVILISILLVRKAIKRPDLKLTYFFLISFFVIFFLMQDSFQRLWDFPLIVHFRSTNRMLLFVAFFTSALAAILYKNRPRFITSNLFIVLICFFVTFPTILNWGSRFTIKLTDKDLLEKEYYKGFLDASVLPIWASYEKNKYIFESYVSKHAEVIDGDAEIIQSIRKTTRHNYIINAKKNSRIKENTLYFPGWIVKINGRLATINYSMGKYPGIITYEVRKGLNNIEIVFVDTPIRRFSQIISLFSLVSVSIFSVYIYFMRKNRKLII